MSKPEWGIKRLCPSCGIKYYDFNKEIIKCPKCDSEFDPDLLLKSRKGRGTASKTEEDITSNNIKEENETLEENVATLDNDNEILEIDETTVSSDIGDDQIETEISEDIENVINDEEAEVTEDEDEKDDDFSVEINDDENQKDI